MMLFLALPAFAVSGPWNQNSDGTPVHYSGRPQVYECSKVEDGKWLSSWKSTGKRQYRGYCAGGLFHGDWKAWHENGEVRWEVEMQKGTFSGRFKAWYDNGQKKAIVDYDMGKRQGDYGTWSKEGQKTAEGHYGDDKQVGCWQTWYANGKPRSKGAYDLDGKKAGKWFYWDEQGNRRKEVNGPAPDDDCLIMFGPILD